MCDTYQALTAGQARTLTFLLHSLFLNILYNKFAANQKKTIEFNSNIIAFIKFIFDLSCN